MQTTKLYENTTKEDIFVNGVGVVKAGDRLSITSEYPTPVNLVNYPGIVEVSGMTAEAHAAELAKGKAAHKQWSDANPQLETPGAAMARAQKELEPQPQQPSSSGQLQVEKNPQGGQQNA